MGMPACTITSQTAHGGVVVLGFPQVLINFLPASRIGDMHACPMVTGIVPHVGGPFILGSPTVLVGFMPQSRVTDQLVCVGPPDVAVMGVETVLVGMAGAGGAAGAAGGISAMGASVPTPPPPASTTQAALQSDGTVATQAAPGSSLPPVSLSQPGFPDLPPEATATFQNVQPVTLPQGTQLFAASDADSNGDTNFWSASPPEIATGTNDVVKVLTVTDPAGMKAWAGQAASQANQDTSQGQQLAQQAVNQTQQALAQATQQAQQQYQAAQAQVQQAQQALSHASAQGKAAAQQALNQAQQQAAAATQQAQQAVQQGRQAANQAQQQGAQVWTSASNAASQTLQKFAMPKKG
jgi:uncharacterized Zn-binding protein involved in type VI secretion